MKPVSFLTTPDERDAIRRIAARAVTLCDRLGIAYDNLSAEMDLAACHANGCPLDFAKLEAAAPADFSHDVVGIRSHMDRRTGELRDCFLPRCAKPAKAEANPS